MAKIHCLGMPMLGRGRALTKAIEDYWAKRIDVDALMEIGQEVRLEAWKMQADAGLDFTSVGDFAWYDRHGLNTSLLVGAIPERFAQQRGASCIDLMFDIARGRSQGGRSQKPARIKKWFNSNYHYVVPELDDKTVLRVCDDSIFEEAHQAASAGCTPAPRILGPLSFLWLADFRSDHGSKVALINQLIPVYHEILARFQAMGVEWVHIEEPILGIDLPSAWSGMFDSIYSQLRLPSIKVLLVSYFGELSDVGLVARLPVDGVHVDGLRAWSDVEALSRQLQDYQVLSVGVVDAQNVWRSDLVHLLNRLDPVYEKLESRLWLAPTASLHHLPRDIFDEESMPSDIKTWLAFAKQRLEELSILKQALTEGRSAVQESLDDATRAKEHRQCSDRIHDMNVKQRVSAISPDMYTRHHPYNERRRAQQQRCQLPLFPTSTIGSFPQSAGLQKVRRDHRQGTVSAEAYRGVIEDAIRQAIHRQEDIDLDVLVAGEFERTDVVEFFAERLTGFCVTEQGWVQSVGPYCVKPPILYGDVARHAPISLETTLYAQGLTKKPIKSVITGPMTLLNGAYVRDDHELELTAKQLALALREEVLDLERAGIDIIQIDEPAFKDAMPLLAAKSEAYLDWAARVFRLTVSGVHDAVQIHVHLCYSDYENHVPLMIDLDADVISLEAYRGGGELLQAIRDAHYPNEIGLGVFDSHAPMVTRVEDIERQITVAGNFIPKERLWVHPDCGLKTQAWDTVESNLRNMVTAAKNVRRRLKGRREVA